MNNAEMVLHDEPDTEFEHTFLKELDLSYRGYVKEEELVFGESLQPQYGTMMFFTSGTNSRIKGTVIALDRFWNSLEPGIPLWNEGIPFGPEITGEPEGSHVVRRTLQGRAVSGRSRKRL